MNPAKQQKIKVELISSEKCLITNINQKLPEELIASHDLVLSLAHHGYIAPLKMLNSLRRFLRDFSIDLPSIPEISLKLYKMTNRGFYALPHIPYQVGPWQLFEHQIKILKFFHECGHRLIIGDQWAMGKTVSALAIAETFKFSDFLIICPKILIEHWKWHLQQFLSDQMQKIDIFVSSLSFSMKNNIGICSAQILQFEIVKKIVSKYKLIIIDEPLTIESALYSQLRQCSSIVILDSNRSHLIKLLPLVNTKIQESELIERYQNSQSSYSYELQLAVYQHYMVAHRRNLYQKPVFIKKIRLRYQAFKENSEFKNKLVREYLKFLIQIKNNKKILLFYQNEHAYDQISKFIEGLLESCKEIQIYLLTLEQFFTFKQQLSFQWKIIFIDHFQPQSKNLLSKITNKIYFLSQMIEYLSFQNEENKIKEDHLIHPEIDFFKQESVQIIDCQQFSSKQSSQQMRIVYFDIQNPNEEIQIESIESYSQKQETIDCESESQFKLQVRLIPYKSRMI